MSAGNITISRQIPGRISFSVICDAGSGITLQVTEQTGNERPRFIEIKPSDDEARSIADRILQQLDTLTEVMVVGDGPPRLRSEFVIFGERTFDVSAVCESLAWVGELVTGEGVLTSAERSQITEHVTNACELIRRYHGRDLTSLSMPKLNDLIDRLKRIPIPIADEDDAATVNEVIEVLSGFEILLRHNGDRIKSLESQLGEWLRLENVGAPSSVLDAIEKTLAPATKELLS